MKFPLATSTWESGNVFTIQFVGRNTYFKKWVEELEHNFNMPKFGYNGEEWDENDE